MPRSWISGAILGCTAQFSDVFALMHKLDFGNAKLLAL
jgi:hypothetical protein